MVKGTEEKKKKKPDPAAPKPEGIKKQREARVTLRIGRRSFEAKSSTQYGHAEMAALRMFIEEVEGEDGDPVAEMTQATRKTVKCPLQPVCGSCTLVLRALGFSTAGGTEFSTEKSGGVSWGASLKVSKFLKDMGLSSVYGQALSRGRK